MNTKTKQRIVGLLVFVIICAVFLPLLFHTEQPAIVDTPKKNPKIILHLPPTSPTTSEVSQQPSSPSQPQQLQSQTVEQLAASTPPHTAVVKPVVEPPKNIQIVHVKQTANENLLNDQLDHVEKAWTLQVATFDNPHYAHALISKLRENGFDAYQQLGQSASHASVIRVYVGPLLQRSQIEQLQRQLKAEYHLNGVIKPYRVSNE